jgi:hypothetical protein
VLARLDPILATPIELTEEERRLLTVFVRHGLLDERAKRENLHLQKPDSVPSNLKPFYYEYPYTHGNADCTQCHK